MLFGIPFEQALKWCRWSTHSHCSESRRQCTSSLASSLMITTLSGGGWLK